MSGITFLHGADVHLGRPFSGLANSAPELRELMRNAGYAAWEKMIQTALERKVDFIILAGDVFDSPNPPVRAIAAFKGGVTKLHEAGIPIFMCLGNHDPLRSFPSSLKSLPGQHLFGSEPESCVWESVETDHGVTISGISFEYPAVTENLARKFKRDPGVNLAVGVLHTNVAGASGHKNYAPCTLNDLRESGMDVWCLGHVHTPGILSETPLILYSGTTQGAHINEQGPRGCRLVTISEKGDAATEFISLAPVRWEAVTVMSTHPDDFDDLPAAVEQACLKLLPEEERPGALIVRIHLTGARQTPCMPFSDIQELLFDRLTNLPVPIFLESLQDKTRPPADIECLSKHNGFLGDLFRLCDQAERDPESVGDIILRIEKELSRTLSRSHFDAEFLEALSKKDGPQFAELLSRAKNTIVSAFLEASSKD